MKNISKNKVSGYLGSNKEGRKMLWIVCLGLGN
jgi:hypothetical protein